MYTERRIVLPAPRISSAGTVTDSMPMNSHDTSDTAGSSDPQPFGANGSRCASDIDGSSAKLSSSSGSSLHTTVTTWIAPPKRTPTRFVSVSPHSSAWLTKNATVGSSAGAHSTAR